MVSKNQGSRESWESHPVTHFIHLTVLLLGISNTEECKDKLQALLEFQGKPAVPVTQRRRMGVSDLCLAIAKRLSEKMGGAVYLLSGFKSLTLKFEIPVQTCSSKEVTSRRSSLHQTSPNSPQSPVYPSFPRHSFSGPSISCRRSSFMTSRAESLTSKKTVRIAEDHIQLPSDWQVPPTRKHTLCSRASSKGSPNFVSEDEVPEKIDVSERRMSDGTLEEQVRVMSKCDERSPTEERADDWGAQVSQNLDNQGSTARRTSDGTLADRGYSALQIQSESENVTAINSPNG
ncbi:hypothetical protein BCR33DRAFT_474193 [Rhizoclosmatium globosum]|uniref:Uncharacterized protein n=1 Tax=Rhizoclosmatium globosum TaxID=329046 RepID=A0A1Y2BPE2_9FUNG|nr:hypothetical protein BCR33DRAFT_474193 [Rhizoclosmatium globosum]|eukprot:ORY36620.1 hypothetical protein BCR33DRAFT_474193 [Rhizoclosmatium globosum]